MLRAARGHVWGLDDTSTHLHGVRGRSGLAGGGCEGVAWMDYCDTMRQVTGKAQAMLETNEEAPSAEIPPKIPPFRMQKGLSSLGQGWVQRGPTCFGPQRVHSWVGHNRQTGSSDLLSVVTAPRGLEEIKGRRRELSLQEQVARTDLLQVP